MKDFYGNEYVASGRWWGFWNWFSKTEPRAKAISAWLRTVCDHIQKRFPDAEVKMNTRPVGPGDISWTDVKIRIKSIGGQSVATLDGNNYDTLTKSG